MITELKTILIDPIEQSKVDHGRSSSAIVLVSGRRHSSILIDGLNYSVYIDQLQSDTILINRLRVIPIPN